MQSIALYCSYDKTSLGQNGLHRDHVQCELLFFNHQKPRLKQQSTKWLHVCSNSSFTVVSAYGIAHNKGSEHPSIYIFAI